MQLSKKGFLTVFFILQILGLKLLVFYPEFIESYYSNGLYVYISKLMRYTFGWLPFSVGDIFYTVTILCILRWLYNNYKRIYRDTKTWFLDVTSVLSMIYFAFHMLWGFNYYRQPLHKTLGLKADYSSEELITFSKRLIKKSNQIHLQLSKNDSTKIVLPYSKSEVFNRVKEGYNELSKTYPHLAYNPKSLKKSIYSLPLTYMGFSGYLNPFTNEAQVDGLIPIYKFPTTSCHEVAHQLGYAAENEANFIGALAAIKNKDLYFKYSGYTFALRYCLAEIYKRDRETYDLLLKTINTGILENYQEAQDFWKSYQNPIEPIFKKTFDTFLKANNQSKGMKTYSYVVALLVNYYENIPL